MASPSRSNQALSCVSGSWKAAQGYRWTIRTTATRTKCTEFVTTSPLVTLSISLYEILFRSFGDRAAHPPTIHDFDGPKTKSKNDQEANLERPYLVEKIYPGQSDNTKLLSDDRRIDEPSFELTTPTVVEKVKIRLLDDPSARFEINPAREFHVSFNIAPKGITKLHRSLRPYLVV
jgi:hypothetical protein